ncbi:aconitase X [Streptomyces spirodelae]|nr:aconitase X catalytic domain-containing protein [Streptomyces spirodelae]
MTALRLTGDEQAMLDGEAGEAVAIAMRLVVGVARAGGARELLPVGSVHVDGCLYHGPAGLDLAERLVKSGGEVAVRTTLNVGSLDLLHPGLVRADTALADGARRLMDAYVALGCEPTWTCAPYQLSHRPAFGTHVAWAESNAIAFVNSVLGARTDRYGDFLDIAAALTGRVPAAGLHLDSERRPVLVLDCSTVRADLWEQHAAWAALGMLLGEKAGTRVAALTGLPGSLDDGVTEDRLKALGATAASAGGVALFHVVGVTPEEVTTDGLPTHAVTTADLLAARGRLSTAADGLIDAVSLGTPHFSVTEFAALAREVGEGPRFAVPVYVSTSRAVLAEATRLGLLAPLEAAGARIVTDTCTYLTPVLDPGVRTVMTSSGKWAWYAPNNLGIDTVLGSLAECVASACAGEVVRDDDAWS